ncbi:MAG: protein kinase domain-containing protein [Gemmatimonadaceae bacterium]
MNGSLRLADRFVLGSLLGEGGMGEVHAAFDEREARPVAVKRLRPGSEHRPELVARLAREGAILRATAHPNIVSVLAVFETASVPCIVMELVPGGSLADSLGRDQRLPVERVLTIALDLSDALARAHRLGIAHCDVKPANVLLAADGTPRLTDFGIAEMFDGTTARPDGVVRGTLAYMSPERWDGAPAGPSDDIWALGVVLYEALAGQRPFTGVSAGMLHAAIVASEPRRLRAIRPDVPPPLDDAIMRMLHKDADARMRSVRELGVVVERLLRGGAPDSVDVTGAVRTSMRATLPHPRHRLVGRADELERLAALLVRDDARLVTLSGPGGVGKTSLALEAAAKVADRFAGGVTFVDLTPVSEPDRVLPAIAQALGVEEDLFRPIVELVAERLASARQLLVLDNFEHVLDAASPLAQLIERAPNATVCTTSRFLLHISAEREFAVPPLATPLADDDAARIAESDAVRLFAERALDAEPSFVLDERSAPVVAEICRRLDGIPLAIELAAARVRTLPPARLLSMLDTPLSLLTGGGRDRAPHQRTLRATVAWSYDLLDARQRTLFRRLSLFVGGWSLEEVDAVLADEHDAWDLPAIVDGLHALLERNLIVRRGDADEPRYDMLVTLRAYAAERLAEDADVASWTRRHARHFLANAERWNELVPTARQAEVLARYAVAHGNLLAALEWTAQREPERLARSVSSLGRYWYFSGLWSEALGWYRRALALAPAAAYADRATVLDQRARLEMFLGDEASARTHHEQAAALAAMTTDALLQARTGEGLGEILLKVGDSTRAWELLEEMLVTARDVGDAPVLATTLTTLAAADVAVGASDRANVRLREALGLATAQGDRALITKVRYHLAGLALLDSDAALAREHCEHGRCAALESGDSSWAQHLDEMYGRVLVMERDWSAAAKLTWESMHCFHALGSRACLPHSLEAAARLCLARAHNDDASDAVLLEAASFVGAADGVCRALSISMFPVERALLEQTRRTLSQQIGTERLATAAALGATWSEAEAVERARCTLGGD